jgi:KaiC/GvpD/RAD55 family RecA-like ATPase
MADSDREALLKQLGRWYGEQRFAIAWTSTNRPDRGGDPKKVTTRGWQHTRPLASGEQGTALFARGLTHNPAIVLRPSGLIGIECDGPEDLARVEALGLPQTLTERSSLPTKRHLYFRQPPELEVVDKVSFRFEQAKLTAAESNYYVCAPALHESGTLYSHLPGLGPGEVEIAEMPLAIYKRLVAESEHEKRERERARASDPQAKASVGERHDVVFAFARANRRRMASEEELLKLTLTYNEIKCEPPMEEIRVRSHVRRAWRLADRSPDADERLLRHQAEEFLLEFKQKRIKSSTPGRRESSSPDKKPCATGRRELRRRATSAIKAKPVEWLIPRVVPLGTLSLVAGVGGLGKSALVLAWAADVTREGSNVLVVSYEDAAEQVLRPRFEALEGNLERLFELSVDPLDGSISFPVDLDELDRHVVETEARLVVIDPVSASIDVKLDSHKDSHVRVVLGQLAKLAERLNLAVVMIAHLNRLSAEVKAAGVKAGISERTMKRAAQDLDVIVDEETTESGRATSWSLPNLAEGGRATLPPTPVGPIPTDRANHAENRGRARGSGHESGRRAGLTLRPGDPGFLEHLLELGEQGQLTTNEWFELSAGHERIVKGRT